jgi:hypothetical protein
MATGRRLAREHNERAWIAWNIAALQRCKRLPPLKSLTIRTKQPRRQTWQEQLHVARMITAAFSGKR